MLESPGLDQTPPRPDERREGGSRAAESQCHAESPLQEFLPGSGDPLQPETYLAFLLGLALTNLVVVSVADGPHGGALHDGRRWRLSRADSAACSLTLDEARGRAGQRGQTARGAADRTRAQ